MISDLLYEILFFMDWKNYYHICEYLQLDFRLKIYFKHNKQLPTIIDLYQSARDYVKIHKYLYKHDSEYQTLQSCIYAIKAGHYETAKYLYKHEHNGILKNRFIHDIELMIQWNHLDMIKYFHSLDPKIFSDVHYMPINIAYDRGYLEMAKYLYDNFNLRGTTEGADWACDNGHLEMIKYLYSIGINPSQRGLKWARENKHIDIVKYLESINICN